ncbi:hypothetical protein EAO71_15910 [Streptomyces sp. ms191]|uniref:hypothetical protein n=1 Tax=Streptomyces sp. ms191 TaxID=1827978 RepID=UPI0011CEC28B|nr:hypothetical protein [Streptomyces sp. ms191]TXS30036.1 hypothetical protein EAO71_15910 [Streptomyces sp. ms191]
MYGPGYVPPPPSRTVPTSVIVLRVVFALLPLFSIGFLTWATMLRLAVVTRRALDWVLCGFSGAVMVTGLLLMPDDIETTQADVAMSLILINAAAFTAYFLVVDIRHDRLRVRAGAPPYPPYATTVPQHQAGYAPPAATPAPTSYQPPRSTPQTPARPTLPPQPQDRPQQQPNPQGNHRIDQVRAELDELSHLLRKDEEK